MNKTLRLHTAFVSLIFTASLHAQNSSSWNLTGNANASSASILGTTNAVPLSLYTKNINRIYIDTFGRVGIGTTNPVDQLHVEGLGFFTQGLSVANGGVIANNTGRIAVIATGALAGVYGQGNSFGVYGTSNGTGITGWSTGGAHGVDGYSSYLGVYGNGANGYGLYGASNNVGVLGYGGGWAGIFLGGVLSTVGYITSDRKLKQNIEEVTNAMDIINKLQPKIYSYKTDGSYKLLNLPQGKHFGFIAQEVEQVLPGLVKEARFDLPSTTLPNTLEPENANTQQAPNQSSSIQVKAVNYTELIAVLVKGMQEQQQQIQALQQQITELKNQMGKTSNLQELNNQLSNASLSQNVPNPVASATTISYSLPRGFNNASMLVTDNAGRVIKSINLNASGTISFDASTLSGGVYNYSLIVNNTIIQTRKMTVIK